MIRGIHHVSLTTANLGRMVEFYTELLGFSVVWDNHIHDSRDIDAVVGVKGASMRAAMLRTGNCFLELFEYVNPPATLARHQPVYESGYRHLALDVVDLEQEYERLSRAGVSFLSTPRAFVNVKGVYGYDPDGNIFEMQEVVNDELPFHITRAGPMVVGSRDDLDREEVRSQGQILRDAIAGNLD